MQKKRRRMDGQITVWISMIMMCMFALFCVLLESARTAGARWYVQMAASSALDSVFSQYHRQLWDSYRLLFAEYEIEEEVEADFAAFLLPYLEVENWYPLEFVSAQGAVKRATQEDGMYLETEILDYMKYGVWNLDFDADTADTLWDTAKEAAAVKDVAASYRGHAREALRLEKSLEAISENLAEQKEKKQEGLSRLASYDGPGFRRTANSLTRTLERMPGLVQTYEKRADELAEGLKKSRMEYGEKSPDCSDPVRQMLEDEISEYEAYVAEDGARRREVQALAPASGTQLQLVEAVVRDALEVERIIDEWEDDDEEDDGPDLNALWRPVKRHFDQLDISTLSFVHGVKDKEKEGFLSQVESMFQAGLLSAVLPEGAVLSDRSMNLAEAPSRTEMLLGGSRDSGFLNHLLVNEYGGLFFRNFCSGKEERICGPEKTVLDYEVEYLLGGADSDEENLADVVGRLLGIREGLNLVHILSDSARRAEARNLAMVITGAAAVTPLLLVTTFFVMSVWALGEALMDVRGLLAGNKIPLMKTSQDWHLSIEQLLAMGKTRQIEPGGGERGLSYLSWLKILLFMSDVVVEEYRMMDVIQENLRLEQNSFCMWRGVYQVDITGQLCGKHVFFSLGFVENLLGGGDHVYPMEIRVERSY